MRKSIKLSNLTIFSKKNTTYRSEDLKLTQIHKRAEKYFNLHTLHKKWSWCYTEETAVTRHHIQLQVNYSISQLEILHTRFVEKVNNKIKNDNSPFSMKFFKSLTFNTIHSKVIFFFPLSFFFFLKGIYLIVYSSVQWLFP